MRKILNNNKKSKRINGTKKGRLGIPYKYGNNLLTGDTIKYGKYIGILLYDHNCDKYGIAIKDSMWYGEVEKI